jgi:cell division protein FtsW (lipid II flippase)
MVVGGYDLNDGRYQPYLVGLGLGWLLHRMRDMPRLPAIDRGTTDRSTTLNTAVVSLLWAAALLTTTLVVYGLVPYQKDLGTLTLEASTAARALYGGLHRLAWALALSWVILACVKVSNSRKLSKSVILHPPSSVLCPPQL